MKAGAQLELRREAGGNRHYLQGEAVHCGSTLELQAIEWRYDDDGGEYSEPVDRWVPVTYEAQLYLDPPRVTLYATVAGRRAVLEHYETMRFRWPRGRFTLEWRR